MTTVLTTTVRTTTVRTTTVRDKGRLTRRTVRVVARPSS
jgi:hypothetical protein